MNWSSEHVIITPQLTQVNPVTHVGELQLFSVRTVTCPFKTDIITHSVPDLTIMTGYD